MSINAPLMQAPFMYINGLQMFWLSNTSISIGSGQCRDSTNTVDIFNNSTVTLDATQIGVNGVEIPIAANTQYAVYIIYDTTGVEPTAGYISPSFSAPVLPFNYDAFLRVGAIITDASIHIKSFVSSIDSDYRAIHYQADNTFVALSGGTSTSVAFVDLSELVPPATILVNLTTQFTCTTAGGRADMGAPLLFGGGQSEICAQVVGVTAAKNNNNVPVLNQTLAYICRQAGSALTIWVNGYVDKLF